MSGNTSATGGFLTPIAPVPEEDDLMLNAIQATVVGVTGLDPTLVRPRWQAKQPTMPPVGVNWSAVGVVSVDSIDFPYIQTTDNEDGSITYQIQRHEVLALVATFYGPNDAHYANVFRDGIYIPQNLVLLNSLAIKLREVEGNSNVPELINNQWVGRTDVRFTLVRQISRDYQVLSILSADGDIDFESKTPASTPWAVP